MNPRRAEKKLNVHAARDGTAAGRYGGAPREHFFVFKKLYREFHGIHGLPWIPWTSMDSMEFHGFHGIPWIPWNSMESMEFHGIHGIPWNP